MWEITKKELLANIITFRFSIGTALFLGLIVLLMTILLGDYAQKLERYNELVAKESEEFPGVNLDIAGYKAAREQEIRQLAHEAAERVLRSGGEEMLPPMNSFERRLVHLVISETTGVGSESIEEEPFRRIVIKMTKSE